MLLDKIKPYVEGCSVIETDRDCKKYIIENKTKEDFKKWILNLSEDFVVINYSLL